MKRYIKPLVCVVWCCVGFYVGLNYGVRAITWLLILVGF